MSRSASPIDDGEDVEPVGDRVEDLAQRGALVEPAGEVAVEVVGDPGDHQQDQGPAVGLGAQDQPQEHGARRQPDHAEQVGHGPHARRACERVGHGAPAIRGSIGVVDRAVASVLTLSSATARTRSRHDDSSWCAASRISPTSSSMTSSRVARPEHRAVGVDDPGHVRAPALQGLERVVQQVVGAHGGERAGSTCPRSTRARRSSSVLQHVLDVQVAEQRRRPSPTTGNRLKPVAAHSVLDVGRGRRRGGTVVSVLGRHQDRRDRLLGEAEGAGQPVVLVVGEQALARATPRRARRPPRGCSVELTSSLSSHAEQPQHARGERVDDQRSPGAAP